MNTTVKFFETKEQYLAFRAAFAAAQNNPRAKRTTVACDEQVYRNLDGSKSCYLVRHVGTGAARVNGWLTHAHFIFLNIVRGKPFHEGYTPKMKRSYIQNGGKPDESLYNALYRLRTAKQAAFNYLNPTPYVPSTWYKFKTEADRQAHIDQTVAKNSADNLAKAQSFLEPFAGTVSIEQLASVEVPTIELQYQSKYEQLAGQKLSYLELIDKLKELQ